MHTGFLIATIVFYILSLVIAALLTLSYERLNEKCLGGAIILHLFFLLAATCIYFFAGKNNAYCGLLLTGICLGIILCGWAQRSQKLPVSLRVYLSIYACSILLFIYSPSLLFYLISGNFDLYHSAQSFHLKDNLFLVEQRSMLKTSEPISGYKVIYKYGIYNKILLRDVSIGQSLDSASLVLLNKDTLILRVHHNDQWEVLHLKPGIKKEEIIHSPKART